MIISKCRMVVFACLVVALTHLASPSYADAPTIPASEALPTLYTFTDWTPGTYQVQITIGPAGNIVSIGPLSVVAVPVLGVVPTTPTDPIVTVPNDLTAKIVELLKTAPNDKLEAMAATWSILSEMKVKDMTNLKKMREFTFSAVAAAGALSDEWKAWNAKLNALTDGDSSGDVDKVQDAWLQVSNEFAKRAGLALQKEFAKEVIE